jgi:hypothetical protein
MKKKLWAVGIVLLISLSLLVISPTRATYEWTILAPSSVLEGREFTVTVLNNSVPVVGAHVGFAQGFSITDEHGQTVFNAPLVNDDTNFTITASTGPEIMPGNPPIVNGITWIIVEDIPDLHIITASPSVVEGEEFFVKVVAKNISIEGVIVSFADQINISDMNGNAWFIAPAVDEDTVIPIIANKSGYSDGSTTILVRNRVTPTQPQLVLLAPRIVTEEEIFEVTVTADDLPVVGVQATFANQQYWSNNYGIITITAPLVEDDQEFSLVATKEEYESARIMIQVVNQPEPEPPADKGIVSGIVTDTSGVPLQKVMVCVILSSDSNVTNSICMVTDENGVYAISAPVGVYTVTASKDGYARTNASATLQKDVVCTLDFTLQAVSSEPEPSSAANQAVIEATIQNKILTGDVTARLSVMTGPSTVVIQRYSPAINISINQTAQSTVIVSFFISADEGTNGTFVVIDISDKAYRPEEISITYDGQDLSPMSVEKFLYPDFTENSEPGYVLLLTTNEAGQGETYLVLKIPHFSTHQITIFSLAKSVEAFGGIITIILYSITIVVLAVITAIPVLRLWRKIE